MEVPFKWIKGHLRIKSFFGTSESAVKTRVWIAVCTYVLVAIVKKQQSLGALTFLGKELSRLPRTERFIRKRLSENFQFRWLSPKR